MKCYYLDEHLKCINYDAGETPILNVLELNEGQLINRKTLYNKLAILVRGKINYSYGMHRDIEVVENNLFFLPSGYHVELKIREDSQLILFHVQIIS